MKIILIKILYILINFIKCNSKKKNLIIGAIKGYKWEIIKPFFISLYKANFKNYDCVIFVNHVLRSVTDKLKSMGIIIYDLPKKYEGMKINNVRYKLYEEYLADKLGIYNMVLHADIRDTFFQRDLFELYQNKGSFIGFSLEEGNISEKNYNAPWMKNQYGEKIYNEIKNNQIICSGTIWGTVDRFYELVKNIWEQIKKKSPYNISIHDQTVTNYLIYHKKLFKDNIFMSNVNYGPVMTVGLLKNNNYILDLNHNILNFKNKKIAAVIHQYDRIPKLVEIVRRRFISKNKTNISFISKNKVINTKINKLNIEKKTKIFLLSTVCLILILILKYKQSILKRKY